MAGIDEVLERLVADGEFRAALARDPAAALAAYDLTRQDVELLASQLDDGDDAERTVEQRTSKSAMLAMLSSLSFGGGAGDDALAEVKAKSWSWGEVKGDGAVPDDLAATDTETSLWELKNAHISSYQTGGSGGDGVPDGVAPDDLTAPDDDGGLYNKAGEIEIESWSWGESNTGEPDDGGASASDDMAMPDEGELYNKSQGKVEYSWKIEEGVKAEVEMDDLTHKVAPTDGEAPMESMPFNYGKVEYEPVADVGDADELGVMPVDGKQEQLSAVPPDDSIVGGIPPDDGIFGGIPPDDGIFGGIPPDDNLEGSNPPDDTVVGSMRSAAGVGDDAEVQGGPIMEMEGQHVAPSGAPGDADEQGIIVIDTKEAQLGATPPDDGIVGSNPPDDGIVGGIPPDDGLAAPRLANADSLQPQVEPSALSEALADEVLEIEDV